MASSVSLHHINYLVRDLDKACDYLHRVLQCQPIRESLAGRDVDTARFSLTNAELVVVCPRSNESTVGQILQNNGEGLFLISFGVDDLEQYLLQLESEGIEKDGPSRHGLQGWLVQDLKDSAGLGSVVQLCQSPHN